MKYKIGQKVIVKNTDEDNFWFGSIVDQRNESTFLAGQPVTEIPVYFVKTETPSSNPFYQCKEEELFPDTIENREIIKDFTNFQTSNQNFIKRAKKNIDASIKWEEREREETLNALVR